MARKSEYLWIKTDRYENKGESRQGAPVSYGSVIDGSMGGPADTGVHPCKDAPQGKSTL